MRKRRVTNTPYRTLVVVVVVVAAASGGGEEWTSYYLVNFAIDQDDLYLHPDVVEIDPELFQKRLFVFVVFLIPVTHGSPEISSN